MALEANGHRHGRHFYRFTQIPSHTGSEKLPCNAPNVVRNAGNSLFPPLFTNLGVQISIMFSSRAYRERTARRCNQGLQPRMGGAALRKTPSNASYGTSRLPKRASQSGDGSRECLVLRQSACCKDKLTPALTTRGRTLGTSGLLRRLRKP
jgi:hypothetical protein